MAGVADILIRRIDQATKELLRRRAERRGKSLEADLRETLEQLAQEEASAVTVVNWLDARFSECAISSVFELPWASHCSRPG
jgi:plasmid stability protein